MTLYPKDTPQIPPNYTPEYEPYQIYLYKHRVFKDLLCISSVHLGNSKECPLPRSKMIVSSFLVGGGHASNGVHPIFVQIMPCQPHQPCFLQYAMKMRSHTYVPKMLVSFTCLQSFDAVGWAAGRASVL